MKRKLARGAPSGRKKAFTLIEVLITVALTGIVASLALTPVVYAVTRIIDTETAYSDSSALRRAAVFMAHDAKEGLRLAEAAVRIIGHRQMTGDDGVFIVATASPSRQNLPAGSVAYKIVRRSLMDDKTVPGLYRWLLAGILPGDVDHEKLEEKNGQLVLPYVTELKITACDPPEWAEDYSGPLPRGIKFALARKDERVEYVLGLPQ